VLVTVLRDVSKGKIKWSQWETTEAGTAAVFNYQVPEGSSHYEVNFCCVRSSTDPIAFGASPGRLDDPDNSYRGTPGYHGTLTIDPETGTILRITVDPELKASGPIMRSAMEVEYGPVEIGGKTYLCPVRSLAISDAKSQLGGDMSDRTILRINEVTFTDYHRFGSTSQIALTAEAGQTESAAPVQAGGTGISGSAPASSIPGPSSSTQASTHPTAAAPRDTAIAMPPSPMPGLRAAERAPAPPTEANTEPEMNVSTATSVPDLQPAPPTPVPNTGLTLRTTSRLVDVPVVAFDKKGQPVTDLKADELEVYDNGRKQHVSFFNQAGAGTLTAPAGKPAQSGVEAVETASANRTGGTAATAAHSTVLLIDSSNVAFPDLNNARQAILRFLKTIPVSERVGLYVLHRFSFQILLEPRDDHAQVEAKLTAWMPSAQDLQQAQKEEDLNRQNVDQVQHQTDLQYVNGNNPTGESDASVPVDPQLRALGDTPARSALAALQAVGRHLGAIPGYKSLVWVASDNVLADFSEKSPDNERGNKDLDPLERRAGETLNDAHVSLYPLDASQLEAGGVGANLESANVQLKPAAKLSADVLRLPPGEQAEVAEEMTKSERDINPGRMTAQMQQDTHPIQGVFRDLATSTGGRALRRAGDIAAELDSIVADGRAAFLLTFTPDTQADDTYHVLTVKCSRQDVTLRYRNGYYYALEPTNVRDRFREAVWQPRDEGEIGLTAATVKDAKGPAVRLSIAMTDLALTERNGRWTDIVDVFLVVRDDSELRAVVAGKRLDLALVPTTYQLDMKDGLAVEESLPKMSGGSLVRLIVIDENSRRMGSVTLGANEQGHIGI
jgi:VWFA-related protein